MSDPITTLSNISQATQGIAQYLPEPATQGVNIFNDLMSAVSNIAGGEVGGVPSMLGGDFLDLLKLQIQTQIELQSVSMVSNVEKSKHESKMAAIRNIRVN